ncbi:hypothetical protein D3C77_707820 [compost metagenome]
MCRAQADVTAEAHVHGTFGWVGQDVTGAVLGTCDLASRVAGDIGVVALVVFYVDEVVFEQRLALHRERDQACEDA